MLTFGWGEILIIFAIIIVVVGPKDLPKLIKQLSSFSKSIRKLSSDFKISLNEIVDSEDFNETKSALNEVNNIKNDLNIKNKFQSEIETIKDTGSTIKKKTQIFNKIDDK